MVSRADDVAVGPAFVVRAARWPLSCLQGLSSDGLAEEARDVEEGRAEWAEFRRRYADAIEIERAHLWSLTVRAPRFLRALATSAPSFCERVMGNSMPAVRNKRARHTETTLYRYLARACGRVEPCELWSGIALGHWSSTGSVERRPCSYAVAPDLRPFQSILRSLGRTSPYQRRGTWGLNPTFERREGRWEYWLRASPTEALARKQLRSSEAIDEVVEALRPLGAKPWHMLVDGVVRTTELPRGPVEEALSAFAAGGAIIGGIDLVPRFASAWEALALSARDLLPCHRRPFWSCYRSTRRICRRLERALERSSPGDILAATAAVRRLVQRLARAFDLDPPDMQECLLRCDSGLPVDVHLPDALRREIADIVDEYARYLGAWDMGRGWIEDALAREQRAGAIRAENHVADPIPMGLATWSSLAELASRDSALPGRLRRWESLLADRGGAMLTLPLDDADRAPLGAPVACVLLRFSAARTQVRGIFNVAPWYSRFWPLWNPINKEPRDDYRTWYCGALSRVSNATGIAMAEIVAPWELNPNALARPRFVDGEVHLWCGGQGPHLASAVVTHDDVASGAPLVRFRPGGPPTAVFSFCSANIGSLDPVAQAMLRSSFNIVGLLSLDPSQVVFDSELEGKPSPELLLPSGVLLRTRRLVIAGEALECLLDGDAPERFARWQKLLAAMHPCRFVTVQRDDSAPLVLPAASAIAVEALLEGARGSTSSLIVEDFSDAAWLEIEPGAHYVAEVAVPFERQRHAWSERRSTGENVLSSTVP